MLFKMKLSKRGRREKLKLESGEITKGSLHIQFCCNGAVYHTVTVTGLLGSHIYREIYKSVSNG